MPRADLYLARKIVDGHNRYEICLKHNILFEIQSLPFKSRDEVIAFICAKQISRDDISSGIRKYLIGKWYESEKKLGIRDIVGQNQRYSEKDIANDRGVPPVPRGIITRTSQRIGAELKISHSTVEKYGAYSNILDNLAKTNGELVQRILSGQTKISHENLVELSKLPARELAHISKQLICNDRDFMRYARI